jgi:DNA polymerase-3 subunit alpha
MGLKILPPDINRSLAEYSAEDKAIRIGLRFIANVSADSVSRIFKARAEAPFASLEEFVARADIAFEETVNLVRLGCFDFLNKKRTLLISKLDALSHIQRNRLAQELLPIDLTQFEKNLEHLTDMTVEEKLIAENRLLGYFVHQHPLEFFAKQADHPSIIKAKDLSKFKGKKVKVIGWLVSAKRIRTRDKKNESGEIIREGEYMKFMTMEDLTDIYDVVLFPKVYEKVAAQTLTLGAFCLEGVVDARYNTINVTRIALIKNHLPIHDDAESLTLEKQEIYARQKAEGFSEADGIVLIEIEPVEYQIVQAS